MHIQTDNSLMHVMCVLALWDLQLMVSFGKLVTAQICWVVPQCYARALEQFSFSWEQYKPCLRSLTQYKASVGVQIAAGHELQPR